MLFRSPQNPKTPVYLWMNFILSNIKLISQPDALVNSKTHACHELAHLAVFEVRVRKPEQHQT